MHNCIHCKKKLSPTASSCPWCHEPVERGRDSGFFQGSLFSIPSGEDAVVNFYKPPFEGRVHEQAQKKQKHTPSHSLSEEGWMQAAFSFGDANKEEVLEEKAPPGLVSREINKLPTSDLEGLQRAVDSFSRAWENEQASSSNKDEPVYQYYYVILILLCLLLGMDMSLFGLVLFTYSKDGLLRLEWVADYWFLYMLLGGGVLYGGFRGFKGFFN